MNTFLDALKTYAKLAFGSGVFKSYGQFAEDAVAYSIIDKHFYRTLKQRGGTYLDIGAFHPVKISNTYAFYRCGWNGIVIDPNPRLEPLFALMRPRDRFVGCGVGATNGTLRYHLFANGAYNTFDERAVRALAARGTKPVATLDRPVKPLHEILDEAGVTAIDLCNIDVEGMDLAVLRSYDWRIRPKIFIIEDHAFSVDMPKESETYAYMDALGYALKASAGYSCVYVDRAALENGGTV